MRTWTAKSDIKGSLWQEEGKGWHFTLAVLTDENKAPHLVCSDADGMAHKRHYFARREDAEAALTTALALAETLLLAITGDYWPVSGWDGY